MKHSTLLTDFDSWNSFLTLSFLQIETQNTTAKDEAIKALENVELVSIFHLYSSSQIHVLIFKLCCFQIRRKNEESRKELERREKERQLAEQQESDLYLLNLKQWAMTPKVRYCFFSLSRYQFGDFMYLVLCCINRRPWKVMYCARIYRFTFVALRRCKS
jgi:hypothetical protein